jgi:autotransporter-associated beta strand protein
MWNGGLVNNAQTELRVTTGNTITWNNQTLQGIGTFTKSGSGKLSLPGMNTFSGGTEVVEGTLEITQSSADNGGFTSIGTGPVTIRSGGTLLSSGHWTTGNEWNNGAVGKITIDQGGTWHITAVGGTIRNGLELRGGQITSTGQANADWGFLQVKSEITATGSQPSTIAVDTALSGPCSISVGAGSRLAFSGNIHNQISTTGALTQSGPGTLVLSGTNTFTGTMTAAAGTVIIDGSLGSSAIASAGATLGGSGTIAGAVNIAAGASLAPGDNGPGTVTAASAAISGELAIEVDGASADRLNVTGNLDITNATLALSGAPAAPEIIIASFGSLTGSAFATVTGLPSGYAVTYDLTAKQIKLAALSTGFAGWIGTAGVANPAAAADPDFDGIPNVIEYILGGDPSQSDSSLAPKVSTVSDSLVFTFNRSDSSETSDITLVVEVGTTLATWPETITVGATSSPGVQIQENEASPDRITVTVPNGGAASKFARLRVLVNP